MSIASEQMVTVFEPAHPDRKLGEVQLLSRGSVESALEGARSAQHEWASHAGRRSAALGAWAKAVEDDAAGLIDLLCREIGKPIREARAEVDRTASILRYYAQAAYDPIGELLPPSGDSLELRVEREPLGTVLLICPWNFPVAIPAWKIAPALACGNVALFKSSRSSLATASRFIELARPLLPAGVLTLLAIDASTADDLVGDPRVSAVSFTGSVDIGRRITVRAASRGASVQAEMGGQNASIVLSDADLDHAATTIAEASMGFAGQKCTATRRVIVDRRVARQFVPLLVDHVRALTVGDPEDEGTVVGPLISESARASVAGAVNEAARSGARPLVGSHIQERSGWFYEPTLLEIDDPAAPFAQEETFGPAAAVIVVEDDEDAIRVANGTRYGLSGSVFSDDLPRGASVARRLAVGLVRVNASTTGVDFYAPFGGERDSSYGPREQGRAAREFYTRTRTVVIRSSPRRARTDVADANVTATGADPRP